MDLERTLLLLVLAAALSVSVVTDLRTRRILDVVTYPALLAALLIRAGSSGLPGVATGLAGAALACVPFLLVRFAGGMGMGDVKLMAVVGAVLGFPDALDAVLLVAVVGAFQAVAGAARAGGLGRTLSRALRLVLRRRVRRPAGPPVTVPYGLSIAIGAVLAVLLP